jgi:hypothetical protein
MVHKYEVVCTKRYLDVGLLITKNHKSKPKRVFARAGTYSKDTEYGGVETLDWINTGVFLSKDEWKNISYNKGTDQILKELGIKKKIYSDNLIVYRSSFPKKQVIGLVFETVEEAQLLVKNKFPEAKLTRSYPYEVITDMFRLVWIPAYKQFCGQRISHLFTTSEIEQSAWFEQVIRPMLTEH